MAEKLCELRKKGGGGGKQTETVLWTNPNPTSSFASQTITLSQSVDNFKYIAIKHKGGTSSTDTEKLIVSVEDLKKSVNDSSTTHAISFIGSQTSGAQYSRIVFYASTTSLTINTAYRVNRAESNDTYAIPLEILGLNELDHGKKFDETVLWTNPSPNTRMPASDSTQNVSVTLSDALSNYDYVKFVFKRNNGVYADMYSDVIYSVEEFKKFTVTAYSFRGAVSCFTSATSNMVARRFSYEDDTTVRFIHAVSGTNASGSVTQAIYDETLIPNQIIGCKFR